MDMQKIPEIMVVMVENNENETHLKVIAWLMYNYYLKISKIRTDFMNAKQQQRKKTCCDT